MGMGGYGSQVVLQPLPSRLSDRSVASEITSSRYGREFCILATEYGGHFTGWRGGDRPSDSYAGLAGQLMTSPSSGAPVRALAG